jgi:ceramide glucosyltransferase
VSHAHLPTVLTALTGASVALYLLMMAVFATATWWRRRRPTVRLDRTPRVSIFKPLAGYDDDLDANLESFARIDYPDFEVLLGVASQSDPGFGPACRFVARHPRLDARVVVTDPGAATNPKVAQLASLERLATGEVFVISDSNVRVKPGYLWPLVAGLRDEKTGMVTSLFAGSGERTLGAALENMQIGAWTTPGIAAMDGLGVALTVGKSMAIRRHDLDRLGGFGSVGHVLAEDFVLGSRFRAMGFRIRASFDVVENRNVDCSIARTMERHSRWAKMRRSMSPALFALEPMLQPTVVATIAFMISPGRETAAAFAVVCVTQSLGGAAAIRLLRGHALPARYAVLEVLRSYAWFACWVYAWASRQIRWRGHPFLLHAGTVITPLARLAEPAADKGGEVAEHAQAAAQ